MADTFEGFSWLGVKGLKVEKALPLCYNVSWFELHAKEEILYGTPGR